MKRIILLGFLLIMISCQSKLAEKENEFISDFDLKTDYLDFKIKMTEIDTIKIGMGVGSCMHQSAERLLITKQKDSIRIESSINEDLFNKKGFNKFKEIVIHENDTTWKMGEFIEYYLAKSNDSLDSYPIYTISKDSTKIKIYTRGIINRDNIVADYCIVMKKIFPESEFHFYGEPIKDY
ncbi:hypothetical protein [Lutibacter oricola]|nr:hypothetical protein [Lutibacter oricola]